MKKNDFTKSNFFQFENMARRIYRKRSRRTSRRLSNRRIYSRTSAKSQASQIALLRNRINRVYRACRPEIKTIVTGAETVSYTSETLSSYYRFYPMTSPTPGTGDKDRIGNFVKVINGVLYLSLEYFNSSPTGYHNTESSGAQVRIVIGQFKNPHTPSAIPPIDSIFEYASNTGANYTQMAVSPFKEGITNTYDIIRDIRFTMTSENNQKMMKIAFKPRIPYVFNDDGHFNNCWACLLVTGLHYDTDFTETVKITVSDKLVFTDA